MTRYLLATAAMALAVPAFAASHSDDSDSAAMSEGSGAAKITVQQSDEYGEYLANGDGRPVYMFTTDMSEDGGEATISCGEDCQGPWPLVTTSGDPTVGDSVDASMLGTMDYEGETVVTFNGHPLYTFAKDEGADGPQGQEVESFGGEWYLLTPEGTEVEGEA